MTRWLWHDAAGGVTDLTDWGSGSYVTVDGTSGELAPSYAFASRTFAAVDGADLQSIAVDPRTWSLGLDVQAADEPSMRARARSLAHVLRPRAGVGYMEAVQDDGTSRTLPCYYSKGLDSAVFRANRLRAVLEFWAPSPWWRGTPWTLDAGLSAPSAFFPILPMVLSSTTIAGATTVDLSDTDAPTSPIWTITGPGDQLTLRNDTSGQSLVLGTPIGDGRVVTIDTRPGRQRVTLDDGTNLFGKLSSDPALWQLADGVQSVSVLLTNAGAASRVTAVADRLYSGAR